MFDPRQVDELIAQAREQGLDVPGQGGLLSQLAKAVMERSLAAELTDHLGDDEGDPAGNGSGNSRVIRPPSDWRRRWGYRTCRSPGPATTRSSRRRSARGQCRREGIDTLVVGLHGRGLTLSATRAQHKETSAVDFSRELLSKITDPVLEETRDWQSPPLDPVYQVIFLDALVCKVRDGGSVKNKAAHLAVGVNLDGKKEVLGIWVETTEVARIRTRVMSELRGGGVGDVLVVVCDGLTELPQAVTSVWPDTIVQTRVVHLTRASLGWVNYKDRKKVSA